jgi:hypothetical protein
MDSAYKLAPGRASFCDARTPLRRMQATHHPDQRVVVVSLWHENVCTATFRLPVTDAPELIGVLVDALATAATDSETPTRKRRSASAHILADLRVRLATLARRIRSRVGR